MTPSNPEIPDLIRGIRKAHKLSQEDLARWLDVSFATVNRWEAGKTTPQPQNLLKLQKLAVSIQEDGPRRNGSNEQTVPFHNRVICGNSIEVLDDLPTDSVDLILSDIPYGIGIDDWDVLHENSNSAFLGKSPAQERAGAVFKRRGKPINGWSSADREIPRQYQDWCALWASNWLRVLKPGGSALIFAGRRYSPRCVVALEDAGFNFRDMLGWIRPRAVHRAQRLSVVLERRGESGLAEHWENWRVGNLRPSFEPIIWCFKPYDVTITDNVLEHGVGAWNQQALIRYFGSPDNVFECGFESGEGGRHAAQKPLRLMQALIELTTPKGALVLDPFAGSGTTAVAAALLGRSYCAIERDPDTCQEAVHRLEEAVQPLLL